MMIGLLNSLRTVHRNPTLLKKISSFQTALSICLLNSHILYFRSSFQSALNQPKKNKKKKKKTKKKKKKNKKKKKKKKKTFITLQLSFTTTFIFSTPFLTPFFPFLIVCLLNYACGLKLLLNFFHSTVPMHDFPYYYTRNSFFIFLKTKKNMLHGCL
jgi:hypothetical protein